MFIPMRRRHTRQSPRLTALPAPNQLRSNVNYISIVPVGKQRIILCKYLNVVSSSDARNRVALDIQGPEGEFLPPSGNRASQLAFAQAHLVHPASRASKVPPARVAFPVRQVSSSRLPLATTSVPTRRSRWSFQHQVGVLRRVEQHLLPASGIGDHRLGRHSPEQEPAYEPSDGHLLRSRQRTVRVQHHALRTGQPYRRRRSPRRHR